MLPPRSASVLRTQLERLITQSKLDVGWKNANFAITAKSLVVVSDIL